MSLTNAEARKLAQDMIEFERSHSRNGNDAYADAARLARWCLTRLGQEDVMDAEVAAIQARHDADEIYYTTEPVLSKLMRPDIRPQSHYDRATLLKKLRATAYALGSIKREEFLACFKLPALTVEDAEASLDEILALMSLHVRVVTPAVTRTYLTDVIMSHSGMPEYQSVALADEILALFVPPVPK